jgi:RNA-directed DNA polymerase
MFYKADRYTRWMHPNKSKDWRHRKYWGSLHLDREDRWVFGDKQTGGYLLKFRWFPIERHVLVKGRASPDDPRLRDYWMKRQAAKAKDLSFSKQKLAKRQKGRCPECGESLFNDGDVQVHHLLARSNGGKSTSSNLALVHLLCHQQIHAKTERRMQDCQQYNNPDLLTDKSTGTRCLNQEEEKEPCCT